MAYARLLYELADGVATIVLNRPNKRNALDEQAYDELREVFVRAGAEDAAGVVGHAFREGPVMTWRTSGTGRLKSFMTPTNERRLGDVRQTGYVVSLLDVARSSSLAVSAWSTSVTEANQATPSSRLRSRRAERSRSSRSSSTTTSVRRYTEFRAAGGRGVYQIAYWTQQFTVNSPLAKRTESLSSSPAAASAAARMNASPTSRRRTGRTCSSSSAWVMRSKATG